jgi:deoxyadenosine/deoxycytidine kinase
MTSCYIIPSMNKLVSIVGASGVGKTALVHALSRTGRFATAYEQHAERPFQTLFKGDTRYALANQVDYFLLRAEQEWSLRGTRIGSATGLMDGGLDLDYHGFSRLFHRRGLLLDAELELCRRLYEFIRASQPPPELIVRLWAAETTVSERLSGRQRINIASADDTDLFNSFLDEWLASLPAEQVLSLDVTDETLEYVESVRSILERLGR